jgi:prepilin-type N-terminal cleavage/methylation domain-containing protein/prepilin-type processing-associated H-X9-DG protein
MLTVISNQRGQGSRNQGFTLIELLVVIAIIAILAAILFPVFAQAREKARQTSCISNEKQIDLAVMMYTQDYDETYPIAWGYYGPWYQTIDPYIKNAGASAGYAATEKGVWHCPSDYTTAGVSYSANAMIMGGGALYWGLGPYPAQTLAGVNAPADCVLAAELVPLYNSSGAVVNNETDFARWQDGEIPGNPQSDTDNANLLYLQNWLREDMTTLKPGIDACPADVTLLTLWAGYCKMISYRHVHSGPKSGETDVMFCDGHVKTQRFGQMKVHNWVPEQLSDAQLAQYDH